MSEALLLIPERRPGSQYTRQQILEAAVHYLVVGQARRVSALTGIPERTICEWRAKEWWEPLTAAIRHDKAEELDAALTDLVHRAVDAAQDRIDGGDYKLRPDGTLARVPLGARDAAVVAAIAIDKRQILRNQPTVINESTADRLQLLREQLAALSGRTM